MPSPYAYAAATHAPTAADVPADVAGISAYGWSDDYDSGYIEDDSPFGSYDDDSYDDEMTFSPQMMSMDV